MEAQSITGRDTFKARHVTDARPIVNVPIHISALRTVRLPLRANVPAQRTRWTNAFAAAMGDKMTMQVFAKIFLTLISLVIL